MLEAKQCRVRQQYLHRNVRIRCRLDAFNRDAGHRHRLEQSRPRKRVGHRLDAEQRLAEVIRQSPPGDRQLAKSRVEFPFLQRVRRQGDVLGREVWLEFFQQPAQLSPPNLFEEFWFHVSFHND